MINDKNSLIKVLEQELPFLQKEYGVERIGLFGSFVRDTVTPESDVDLVIEFNKPIGFGFFRLSYYLEEKLERKVDIISPLGLQKMRIKKIADSINNELEYFQA